MDESEIRLLNYYREACWIGLISVQVERNNAAFNLILRKVYICRKMSGRQIIWNDKVDIFCNKPSANNFSF